MAVRSFASALLLLLFAAAFVAGNAIDAAKNGSRSAAREADRRRRAKVVRGDYNECLQAPTLHCRNGSTCRPGSASFGEIHAHLDLQTQENGYYCDCPPGFIGHECEVEVEDCSPSDPDDPVHSCYHGSECPEDGYACDCGPANDRGGPTDPKFAGDMCQHQSTSMCAVSLSGTHAPDRQFCANHGECVKLVSGGEPHPGCLCAPGWGGDHCEVLGDAFGLPRTEQDAEEEAKKGSSSLLWIFVVVPVVVGALVAWRVDGMIKAQKAIEEAKGMVFHAGQNGPALSGDNLDADGSGALGGTFEIGSPKEDDLDAKRNGNGAVNRTSLGGESVDWGDEDGENKIV